MTQQTESSRKIQDAMAQLNSALLQKEVLSEQLEELSVRIRALRNFLAGAELGQHSMTETRANDTNN